MSIKFYDSNGKYWGKYDERRSLFIPKEDQTIDLTFEKAEECCKRCGHYKLTCDLFSEICKYEPQTEDAYAYNEDD